MANPIGQNGLPILEAKAEQPRLVLPDFQTLTFLADWSKPSLQNKLDGQRFDAFNEIYLHEFDKCHCFSLSCKVTRERLYKVEVRWSPLYRSSRDKVEELFWKACYERHNKPADFKVRERYLRVVCGVESVNGQRGGVATEAQTEINNLADQVEKLEVDPETKVATMMADVSMGGL